MTDGVAHDIVNAIDRQTRAIEALVVVTLLQPERLRAEPEEVLVARAQAKVLLRGLG